MCVNGLLTMLPFVSVFYTWVFFPLKFVSHLEHLILQPCWQELAPFKQNKKIMLEYYIHKPLKNSRVSRYQCL